MCTLCQSRDPSIHINDPHVVPLNHGTVNASFAQTPPLSTAAGLPNYTVDQAAAYLTTGFWADRGTTARAYNVTTGGTITVNLDGLDAAGRTTALQALDAWSNVSGLRFEQSSNAMMNFEDDNRGAYSSSIVVGGTILESRINVDDGWQRYGDYFLQTYIHEIGHALGLGHSGDYNGSASFGRDAHYANDSWQMTVMSYFDQRENANTDASRAYVATAQVADIVAVQALYGAPTTIRLGDSIYGDGATTDQVGMGLPSSRAVTIVDNGGVDTINLASRSHDQTLDLRAEHFSDINERVGTLAIGRDTVIENAATGAGDDHITGNAVANRITSGAGDDTLSGGSGDDVLMGGAGADQMTGGAGADRFAYTGLEDAGDVITDFSLADGDIIDIDALFAQIGYTGQNAEAEGVVALQSATGGAYLLVDADGTGGAAGTQLVFLAGLDASLTTATALTGVAGAPAADVLASPDTTYRFNDSFVSNWTPDQSAISDQDGGTDTLDLQEVTHTANIHLTEGVSGQVGERAFSIAPGSMIENLLLGTRDDRGYGNTEANLMDGGSGDDVLYGRAGADSLIGGAGNDRLYGGNDTDFLIGGEGRDTLSGNIGADTLEGGAGNDSLRGGWGDDLMAGGAGRDTLRGQLGNDTLDGGAGNDLMQGGWGDDDMSGGWGNDNMRGQLGDDRMAGGAGNDLMAGGTGDDTLRGGTGRDFLRGQQGNDHLSGEDGADKILGGAGHDVVYGGAQGDYLRGGEGNDMLWGEDGADRIYGDRGADTLEGGAGADQLWGGQGADVVNGGSGTDKLYGNAGNDTLTGGADNDRLYGAGGDDVLIGGTGRDLLYGGTGADTFVYTDAAQAGDAIRDFSISDGDRIDISALLGDITVQDAIDSGTLSLHAVAGNSAWLELDLDGTPDTVQLALITNLDADTALTEDWLF